MILYVLVINIKIGTRNRLLIHSRKWWSSNDGCGGLLKVVVVIYRWWLWWSTVGGCGGWLTNGGWGGWSPNAHHRTHSCPPWLLRRRQAGQTALSLLYISPWLNVPYRTFNHIVFSFCALNCWSSTRKDVNQELLVVVLMYCTVSPLGKPGGGDLALSALCPPPICPWRRCPCHRPPPQDCPLSCLDPPHLECP